MPLIEVTLAEGRSPEQIRAMMHEVHEAVLRTVDTRSQHIRVIVREVPRTHWATGDLTLHETGYIEDLHTLGIADRMTLLPLRTADNADRIINDVLPMLGLDIARLSA